VPYADVHFLEVLRDVLAILVLRQQRLEALDLFAQL